MRESVCRVRNSPRLSRTSLSGMWAVRRWVARSCFLAVSSDVDPTNVLIDEVISMDSGLLSFRRQERGEAAAETDLCHRAIVGVYGFVRQCAKHKFHLDSSFVSRGSFRAVPCVI